MTSSPLRVVWRWVHPNPTEHHELLKLELPGAWEPPASSRAFNMVKVKGPSLVFLMETEKKKSYLEKLRCRLKFDNLFIVPQRNLSGSLALLWSNDLDLHIHTFSPHHIEAVVNPRIDDAWRFTGFYGAPEVANREDSWYLLWHLATQFNRPWVCIGDFNKIT